MLGPGGSSIHGIDTISIQDVCDGVSQIFTKFQDPWATRTPFKLQTYALILLKRNIDISRT